MFGIKVLHTNNDTLTLDSDLNPTVTILRTMSSFLRLFGPSTTRRIPQFFYLKVKYLLRTYGN